MSYVHSHRLPTVEQALQKYEHGTYARYTLAKCRCFPCRQAASQYEYERQRRLRNPWRVRKVDGAYVVRNVETGEVAPPDIADELLLEKPENENELISAREAREHIMRLGELGVGRKRIAAAAGYPYSSLQRVIDGQIKRIKRCNAEKILAVGRDALTRGVHVDATFACELVRRLRAAKYKRYVVATEVGRTNNNFRIWVRPVAYLRLETVRAIHDLYVRLQQTDTNLERVDPHFVAPAAEPAYRRNVARSAK